MFWYNVKCAIADIVYSAFTDLFSILYHFQLFTDDTEKKIISINKAGKLPFALLSYYKPKNWDDPAFSGGNIEHWYSEWGDEYSCEDWKVGFGCYPYDISPQRLNKMTLLSARYSLCGLSVGMDISECGGVLERYGFTQTESCCFSGGGIPPFGEYIDFIKEKGWETHEDINKAELHERFKEYYSEEICKMAVWKFNHTDKIKIELEFTDDKLSSIEIYIFSEYISDLEY